jgi:sarcosine oxidase
VASRFSGVVAPTPTRAESCMFTDTPDGEYVLKREGDVVYAAACCGRGFKYSPLTGERLASLALAPSEAVA